MAGVDAVGDVPSLAIDGAIATITLRRPAVANRLAPADLATLQAQIAQVDAQTEVRVLCLRGEGRHFCSGFDIGQVGADGGSAGARFEALADAIERTRPITIAVLHGGAYGGAVDLALACDFRLGGPDSEMAVPAAKLGLHFYRGGLERFVTRLGLAAAKRILLGAQRHGADEMLSLGVLDRRCDSTEALQVEVAAFSAQLAALAPLSLLGMKKHLNRIARGALDATELARDIAAADASEDLHEGAKAWQDKRTPRFTGH